MKTKNHKHKHKSVHQHVEELLRHKASLGLVTFLMFAALASFDVRVRSFMKEAYIQGWGWIDTCMRHEHPTHAHNNFNQARMPTISGPGPS